jgi:glycosyltransferase involved in cell wall biosynthesis
MGIIKRRGKKMNILYWGEVGDSQSWGITTIHNVRSFSELGVNVVLRAKQLYGNVPHDIIKYMSGSIKPDFFLNQGLANMMGDLSAYSDMDIKRIGICCWDSSLIPKDGIDYLNNNAHGVIALSKFTRDAFLNSGLKIPVHVGDIGVDTDMFAYYDRPKRDVFTFVFTGVAQGRKGTQNLINAFERVLGNNPKAKLIIKSNSWGKLGDYGVKCNNVQLIYEEWSRDRIAQLYKDCDCWICPTEGDSFLMPGLEAMSTGLPLIITDFGGPRDYCDDFTGYPVKCTLKDAVYIPGHQANVDLDDLAYKIKHVFDNQDEAKEKGKIGASRAVDYWTWTKDAERNINFLRGLV